MEINLYNIEEKIFLDSELQKKLPDFKEIFEQWKFYRMVGGMASKIRESEINLINSIESKHIEVMSKHFNSEIKIKKLKNNITKNFELSFDCEIPTEAKEYREFCVHRNKNGFNLTFWR